MCETGGKGRGPQTLALLAIALFLQVTPFLLYSMEHDKIWLGPRKLKSVRLSWVQLYAQIGVEMQVDFQNSRIHLTSQKKKFGF